MKVIDIYSEKCRNKNGILRNSNINEIILRTLPIQNHLKLSVTEKRWIKSNIEPEIPYDLSFWRRPTCHTQSKAVDIWIGIAWVSPGLSKTNNSISNNFVRRYEVDWRDPKLCWKLEKNPHLLVSSASPSFVKFFKYFTYNRKKTNRAAGFSHWPLPNTFKYKDGRWDVPSICKARFFQTYVEFS